MKRILAWVLLVGFILLIMNIFWWKIAMEFSFVIYIAIVAFFLLSRQAEKKKEEEEQNNKQKQNEKDQEATNDNK